MGATTTEVVPVQLGFKPMKFNNHLNTHLNWFGLHQGKLFMLQFKLASWDEAN